MPHLYNFMAKTNREISMKREKAIGEDFNGYSVLMSGGRWDNPGDAKTDKYLFEDKFTKSDAYVLKNSTLVKIEKQAYFARRIPIFKVGFTVGDNTENGDEFIILKDVHCLDEAAFGSGVPVLDVAGKSFRLRRDYLRSTLENNIYIQLNFLDTKDYYIVCRYSYLKSNSRLILGK
jgi:hypothetical protein